MKHKRKIEKAAGKRLAFTIRNTVFNITRNDKDRWKPMNIPGVFKIKIDNRDTKREELYIGSTRSIKRRLQEHKADQEKAKGSMALAQRLLNFEAIPKWDQTKVVSIIVNREKLREAEAVEIFSKNSADKNVINYDKPEKISLAWEYCEKKKKKVQMVRNNH